MASEPWHALEADEVLRRLGSSGEGLSDEEAEERLRRYGFNEVRRERRRSGVIAFLKQFTSFLVLILIASVAIALVAGLFSGEGEEYYDAVAIGAIILLNGALGFYQERKAERALEAVKRLAAPVATVIRKGVPRQVSSRLLVPGDLVEVETGSRVPADARLIDAVNLEVDESSLTGESEPVPKITQPLPAETPSVERMNTIFGGTLVTRGRGRAAVFATGMETEVGRIVHLIQQAEEEATPLQRELERLGKQLAVIFLALSALFFLMETVLRGEEFVETLLIAVSLAVAAVPEGLPAIVTITLALGVQNMARNRAVVRRLLAVETLGGVTTICTDKTGTVTRGELTVREILVPPRRYEVTGSGYIPLGSFLREGRETSPGGDQGLMLLLKAGALCSDAHLVEEKGGYSIAGDPTEGAVVVAAAKAGLDVRGLRERFERVGEIPFDSVRKMMTTLNTVDGGVAAYVKGAPEAVLERATRVLQDGVETELSEDSRRGLLGEAEAMASRGLRVLALAYRTLPEYKRGEPGEDVESSLTLLGLVGMMDAPRPEAVEAIKVCKRAGIRVVMVTGDHRGTALTVAAEVGIAPRNEPVVTGEELKRLSDSEVEDVARSVNVFARVDPEDKTRIVKALRRLGEVVAVTGDGVNDGPALKAADMGVAMGVRGTDVAKEASDMVLGDDNFATIVQAVRHGRIIYDNMSKFVLYLLSANIGEVLLLTVAVAANLPPPLAAVHLLWINLLTDGVPALALGVDQPADDVMQRGPAPKGKGILSRARLASLLIQGAVFCAVSLSFFEAHSMSSQESLRAARTSVFAAVTIFELIHSFNYRSPTLSVFSQSLRSYKWLGVAASASLALTLAAIYVPFLAPAFGTLPLPASEWPLILASSSSILIVFEVWKLLARRGVLPAPW